MDFKEHLINSIGLKEADLLLKSLNESETHAVILDETKITDEEFLKEFPLVKPHPFVKHAFIYDKNVYPLGKHLYHELGYYYLQDPSAMMVASLIDFKEDDIVLDMCAAPGGKTIQASLKMYDEGLIIANDLSFSRCGLLSNNIERLGIGNVVITNDDFLNVYSNFLNTFDKIILDAPCSGSGMFRKNDEMLKDWSINKVYKYQEIQKSLIDIAYQMLKPGGELSYSTCSYSLEEDEDVIRDLLSKTDAELIDISKYGWVNPNNPIGIRLMPSHFEGEGQYICHIKKPGISTSNSFSKRNIFPKIVKGNYDVIKAGDYLFATKNGIDFSKLHIYRYGVKVGEFKNDYFRYDLHFARSKLCHDLPEIELNLEEVKSYLYGNQLSKSTDIQGYVLLKYKNNAIDIAKSDTKVIKNYYPKGLRKKL